MAHVGPRASRTNDTYVHGVGRRSLAAAWALSGDKRLYAKESHFHRHEFARVYGAGVIED